MADLEKHSKESSAQPPEENTSVVIDSISKIAGGVPAIVATLKSTWSEMGMFRGTRTVEFVVAVAFG